MSLVNEGNGNGGMVMPVAPMANGGFGTGGFGWGDGSFWIIILFLFAMMGGNWNGFGGFGGGGMIPYMMNNNTNSDVQRGFDQSAVMNGINDINSALAAAEVSRCNSQTNILQTLSNNQMGLYQTLNANQNASNQNMNSLAMSLQNCCCENRAGLADLKYTVATEACSDRQAVNDGIRDVMAANTANTQALLNTINNGIQSIQDKLCQQEIDQLKTQNANLQTQINLANMQASQTAQTARILADNQAQTQALEQYLNPAPIPAYMVQNPNCCAGYGNYGCGGNF